MRLTEPRTFHWTREEFYRLADQGFFQERRVELLEGEIVEMPVPKPPHTISLGLADKVLQRAFGPDFWVRNQSPLNPNSDSVPQPDLAVVPGSPRDYPEDPAQALLVVEISETTLSIDRGRKANLYASAGIEDYWIVNLVNRQLEVRRTPVADPAQSSGYAYADLLILQPTDHVAPLALPAVKILVADLLP